MSLGQLSYFIVPGTDSMFSFIHGIGSGATDIIIGLIPIKMAKKFLKPFLSAIGKGISGITALVLSIMLTKYVLLHLPLLSAIIAIGIVLIMYIYELLVFAFISPFVVAFSVTTGQGRKLLDFLVTGLTIFVKPTIIVISIYLSIFLYGFFQDFFILMVDEQFHLSIMSSDSFWSEVIFYMLKETLFIFSIFASIYIMWKVILGLPDLIFRIIGLDKLDTTTQLSEGMRSHFNRYGFNA